VVTPVRPPVISCAVQPWYECHTVQMPSSGDVTHKARLSGCGTVGVIVQAALRCGICKRP